MNIKKVNFFQQKFKATFIRNFPTEITIFIHSNIFVLLKING